MARSLVLLLLGVAIVSKILPDRDRNDRGLCRRNMGRVMRSGSGETNDLKGLAELPA